VSRLPPPHLRDPGDAWVELPDGRKFWGRFGAAGLLVLHDGHALLQHRVEWSHFGGTWGLPGGARHLGESAVDGAIREANEEAGVPFDGLRVRATRVLDLDVWTYTTVIAEAIHRFEPEMGDAESLELRWVPLAEVPALPLHPGLAASWDRLVALATHPATLVVDVANVMGSRPDGWWRDRAGAAERLGERLALLAAAGVPGALLGADAVEPEVGTVWPEIVLVLEGAAREASVPDAVRAVIAPGSGDDAIVTAAEAAAGATVVTADRELRSRVEAVGGRAVGPGALWELLDALE
jgi:8-oxo-dGTP diphosphatase